MYAIIGLEDAAGQKTTMRLNGLPDAMTTPDTKLDTLVTAIQTHFNGALRTFYAVVPDVQALTIASKDKDYQSSMHKGLITCGFAVGDDQRYRNVWIPAPDLDRYELVSGVGYRMKAADLTLFLTALNTASDTTHTIRQGVLEFRGGRMAKPSLGGVLVMKDHLERSAYMRVPDVTDKAKLAAFAASLGHATTGFTTAGISQAVIFEHKGGVKSTSAVVEKGHDSIALRSKCRFSWEQDNKLHFMSLQTPTLKKAGLQTGSGSDAGKETVTQTVGDALATALTTFYSSAVRDLTFESGYSLVDNGKR